MGRGRGEEMMKQDLGRLILGARKGDCSPGIMVERYSKLMSLDEKRMRM